MTFSFWPVQIGYVRAVPARRRYWAAKAAKEALRPTSSPMIESILLPRSKRLPNLETTGAARGPRAGIISLHNCPDISKMPAATLRYIPQLGLAQLSAPPSGNP
jgi:hypothetical protein